MITTIQVINISINSHRSLFLFSVSCVGFWFLKIIYSFLSVLGLYCCTRAFSSFSSFELLIAVASLVEDLRLLSAWAWVIVAHGLSCSVTYRIFPDQISNPCPLR